MSNHILIFSDHRGNERFFLRRRATTADLQRWLASCSIWVEEGAPWASLKWEEVLSTNQTPVVSTSVKRG
jgi:hypothetical protein